MLGQNAGENFWPAMIGFLLTGVGLPLLTVIAISLSGNGMRELASHAHPLFGIFFTVVVYIAIIHPWASHVLQMSLMKWG